jgi:hypothetical protein
MTRRFAVLALPLFALTVVACGDDESSPSRAATATEGDAFCTAAEKVDALSNSMGEALFGGDPAAAEAALAELVSAGEAAEKVAPTDIQQRVTTSIDGFQQLQTQLKKYNFDLAAAEADPEVLALLQNEELEANGDALDTYLSDKCGIAPG